MEFSNVTAKARANIYFEGKVVSHQIVLADGQTKTMGVIFAGDYHFGTERAERMEITEGSCKVKLDGSEEVQSYEGGTYFDVPANSGFSIEVATGVCQYVCSYIDAS